MSKKNLPEVLTRRTKTFDLASKELNRSSKNEIKNVGAHLCLYNSTNSSSIEATDSDGDVISVSSILFPSFETT